MGIQGTEVAKEKSDIIILDDNFESVVKVGILRNQGIQILIVLCCTNSFAQKCQMFSFGGIYDLFNYSEFDIHLSNLIAIGCPLGSICVCQYSKVHPVSAHSECRSSCHQCCGCHIRG